MTWPVRRDADGKLVIVTLNGAHGEDVKQLRVQRPPVELKDQVANRRSDGVNTHSIFDSASPTWAILPDYINAYAPHNAGSVAAAITTSDAITAPGPTGR